MSEIDWSKAPSSDGVRYNSNILNPWLRRIDAKVEYFEDEEWVPYISTSQGNYHWREATPQPYKQAAPNDVDATITQRGERYGKFKDGAVIMQDLKNVMRETPNWEGLTPGQREALEMIQHKIGRILNGDPTYDDNWRDICGYSQLILDELNGAVR